jgi:hypothetical protein
MTAIMKAANDTPNSRRSRNLIPSPSVGPIRNAIVQDEAA